MKLKNFDPSQFEFSYKLTEDMCFRIKTGLCSLELSAEELVNYDLNDESRGSVNYCRTLYNSIIQNGFKKPIFVAKFSCNHFGFTDGQHRTCIAKTKGLTLPANIGKDQMRKCQACISPHKSIFLR